MEYRQLGKCAISVSALSLGCSSLMSRYGKDVSTKAIHAAIEQGINFFDTADFYGQGESERLLGKTLLSKRSDVIIASKAGLRYTAPPGLLQLAKNVIRPIIRLVPAARKVANRGLALSSAPSEYGAAYLEKAVTASLRRLSTDYLDLFYLHSPPFEIVDCGDVFQVLESFRQRGLIRAFGVASSLSVARRAMEVAEGALAVVQVPLIPWCGTEMAELFALSQNHQVALTVRELVRNSMTARQDPAAVMIAANRQLTGAQLALLFGLSQPQVASAVCGMVSAGHAAENSKCFDVAPLTAEELDALRHVYMGTPA